MKVQVVNRNYKMKIQLKPLLLLLLTLFVIGCKEDSLKTYDENESGSSIYFSEKYARTDTSTVVKKITFATAPIATDSIIEVYVAVTGAKSTVDRPYSISIADSSSMIKGTHYELLTEPVISAGKLKDTLQFKLYRTSDLQTTRVYLNLSLQANENFNLNLPYYTTSSVTQNLLSYTFSLEDMRATSFWWQSPYTSYVTLYLGTFSYEKVALICNVMDLDPGLFYDKSNGLLTGLVSAIKTYMSTWLLKEELAGRIYYDENGVKITIP